MSYGWHPGTRPAWYRRQTRRWAAIERRGWKFDGPGIPLPGFVALVMHRRRTTAMIECPKAGFGDDREFRKMHTALLEAAERVAFGKRRAA